MKRRLPRIAQDVAIPAAVEGHAYEPVNLGANVADRVHLLVNGVGRHIAALKRITIEPAEVTFDLLLALDFLDAVDRSSLTLALAKKRCCLLALDLDHFADEIIAQWSKMS